MSVVEDCITGLLVCMDSMNMNSLVVSMGFVCFYDICGLVGIGNVVFRFFGLFLGMEEMIIVWLSKRSFTLKSYSERVCLVSAI